MLEHETEKYSADELNEIKKIGKDSINLVVRLFDEDTSRLTDILVSKFYSV